MRNILLYLYCSNCFKPKDGKQENKERLTVSIQDTPTNLVVECQTCFCVVATFELAEPVDSAFHNCGGEE